MDNIITWCNENNGFLTAVLSMVGLLVSIIAIIVSIQTARLPYKKKLLLSSYIAIAYFRNKMNGEINSEISGISVNAANVGSRNINITYLGFLVKDKSLSGGKQKMTKIRDKTTGTGIIAPTEIKTELYPDIDLRYSLNAVGNKLDKVKVYIYATDSEGHEYVKYMGKADKLICSLQNDKEEQ